jgi:RNA polymerase sigma-70 factor (ECF subfamily)
VTEAEFKTVFDAHKDAIYRFLWRMTGSPAAAEDLTQDVFFSLLRLPQRFNPARGTMRSFLLGIARNLALKRWRDEHQSEEPGDEHFVSPLIDSSRGDIAETVGKAIQSLPPLQREVVILAEYEELSLDEIARAVDAEVGTVKSRLHRARENLRRMLAHLKPAHIEEETRSTNHGTVK